MPSRKPTLVRAQQIDRSSRVHAAMHHTLNTPEPLWLMIPIDEEQARELEGVTLEMQDPEKDITYRLRPQV